jgi:hypothetical protein
MNNPLDAAARMGISRWGNTLEIDMTQTFDFGDGRGPVPAHQHPNGGGWVADTATVCATTYVGPDARVYGNAHISGDAHIYGNARIYGNALVKRGEYTSTPTIITRSDGYVFTLQSDGSIVAGCQDKTQAEAFEYWGNPKHHKHAESIAIVNALYAIAKARRQS